MSNRFFCRLVQIKPTDIPPDNDFLIGAFMASGNTGYIKRILSNYMRVSDDMARDAIKAMMKMKQNH